MSEEHRSDARRWPRMAREHEDMSVSELAAFGAGPFGRSFAADRLARSRVCWVLALESLLRWMREAPPEDVTRPKCAQCKGPGEPWHTCPYQEEINHDDETECTCCADCVDQCCQAI